MLYSIQHLLLALAFLGTTANPIPDKKIGKDCTWNGKTLHGKIKFVENFPDIKVKFVENFPDLKVRLVQNFPDDCGEWQIVENFPDLKIQVVDNFPDITVKLVENFPGLP